MIKITPETELIYSELEKKKFHIIHGDGKKEINNLVDKSIKLMYGSPPYPNAIRNYRTWAIDKYIIEISPFIENVIPKLTDDGFIVINVKANRAKATKNASSERSLIVEDLMLHMKRNLGLYCVDIEIWVKSNPVPTGVRVACIDAYEYNLWFSKSPKWRINIDSIRKEYAKSSLAAYKNNTYKPRENKAKYVTREKKIEPHPLGALPVNVIYGAVSNKSIDHQAIQPEYIPEKYILACTDENDIVLDPWVGSGTTGIVALKYNRRFIGIDISKTFANLSISNIERSVNCEGG